jgi:asparagine synthase (glutamine-hydrolysing)
MMANPLSREGTPASRFSGWAFLGAVGKGLANLPNAQTIQLAPSHVIHGPPGRPSGWVHIEGKNGIGSAVAMGPGLLFVTGALSLLQSALATRSPQAATEHMSGCAVVLHFRDEILISADIPGLLPVYLCLTPAAIFYASSAILLAEVAGVGVSLESVAATLVDPVTQDPLAGRSMFQHIARVPPGHVARISGRDVTVESYWKPPRPHLTIAQAAEAFREVLTASIRQRIRSANKVSADLSGGFDSSVVAVIAARLLREEGRLLNVLTYGSREDPTFADGQFADQILRHIGDVSSTFLDLADCPAIFEGIMDGEPKVADRPSGFICGSQRLREIMRRVESLGSDVHLTGHGGDAVVEPPPLSHWSDLIRTWRIPTFIREVGKDARVNGSLDRSALLGALLKAVLGRSQSMRLAVLRWKVLSWKRSSRPVSGLFPPWMTKHGLGIVATQLEAAATAGAPRTQSQAQLASITAIRSTAEACALMAQQTGVPPRLEHPFLDPAVIHLALAVRSEEKTQPSRLKPFLTSTFASEMPNGFFERGKKSSISYFTNDLRAGFGQNLGPLLELIGGRSILAELGLIEPKICVDHLKAMKNGDLRNLGHIIDTVSAEIWLHRVARSGLRMPS